MAQFAVIGLESFGAAESRVLAGMEAKNTRQNPNG